MSILTNSSEELGTSSSVSSANNTASHAIKNLSKKENTLIREIEVCLAPCSECTGVYIDVITGNRLRLICRHSCHTITKKREVERPSNQSQQPPANEFTAVIKRSNTAGDSIFQ